MSGVRESEKRRNRTHRDCVRVTIETGKREKEREKCRFFSRGEEKRERERERE